MSRFVLWPPGIVTWRRLTESHCLMLLLLAPRFDVVGYGCMTCIGNSGPLPEPVVEAITQVITVCRSSELSLPFNILHEPNDENLKQKNLWKQSVKKYAFWSWSKMTSCVTLDQLIKLCLSYSSFKLDIPIGLFYIVVRNNAMMHLKHLVLSAMCKHQYCLILTTKYVNHLKVGSRPCLHTYLNCIALIFLS